MSEGLFTKEHLDALRQWGSLSSMAGKAGEVVASFITYVETQQASEAEAEKWTRRDFAIFEEEVIRCKEQHPHYTWNEIGRERQMLYVRTMQRLLAELRSEPKLLPEGYTPPAQDTAVELERCKQFIECRRDPRTQYVSPQRKPDFSAIAAEICNIVSTLDYAGHLDEAIEQILRERLS